MPTCRLPFWSLVRLLVLSVLLVGLSADTAAQTPFSPSGPSGAVAASPSATVLRPSVADVSAPVSDPFVELTALRNQVRQLKTLTDPAADHQTKVLVVAAILAYLLRLLLSVLSRVQLLTSKGKDWIPGLVTLLGAGLTLLSHYLGGEDWLSSFLIGGSGPGAVFLHEALDMLHKASDWWKARNQARTVATQLAIQQAVAAHLAATTIPVVPLAAAGAGVPTAAPAAAPAASPPPPAAVP